MAPRETIVCTSRFGNPATTLTALAMCVIVAVAGCQKDPVSQALKDLRSTDPQVRLSAANVLLSSRTMRVDEGLIPDIEASLAASLKDADAAVRRSVAKGLVAWSKPALIAAATDAMVQDLGSEEASVRNGAVQVLVGMPGGESTRGLTAALDTDDPELRTVAAQALERRQSNLSAPQRTRLLLTLDRVHRVVAEGDATVPMLVAMLDGDPAMRASAAHALAHMGDAEAAAAAMQRCVADLSSTTTSTRAAAARTLAHATDANAIAALQALIEGDSDARVRTYAQMSVYVQNGNISSIVTALNSPDDDTQVAAIRAVGELRDKRAAVGPLVAKLASESDAGRGDEIVRALEVSGALSVDPLIKAIGAAQDRAARLRLARAINHPAIYKGMTETQQFNLYNLQQAEGDSTVKDEMARVLSALE